MRIQQYFVIEDQYSGFLISVPEQVFLFWKEGTLAPLQSNKTSAGQGTRTETSDLWDGGK